LGDVLRIRKGSQLFEVVVNVLSEARRSAPEAALLYTETPASQAERLVVAAQQRNFPAATRRPNKQDRRRIKQFTAPGSDTEDT
jgi:ribosome-associated heat shock protein Hsp15